jgi:hypothetical protein
MSSETNPIRIGPLRAGGPGSHMKLQRFDLAQPTVVTNATSTKPLDLVALWAGSAMRPGALHFKTLPSRGQGC